MKNSQKQTILSDEQKQLIAELVDTYGIEPSDVVFFAGEEKPFLGYEASCVIANQLLEIQDIDISPIETSFVDSISLKCTLGLPRGHFRSSVGVANINETIDGDRMSQQQLFSLASGRAIRAALRTAGIDLITLHQSRGSDTTATVEFTGNARDLRSNRLAEVHLLGEEAGLIDRRTGDRSAWRTFLFRRYGIDSSGHLTDANLADLAAVLKTFKPANLAAAA